MRKKFLYGPARLLRGFIFADTLFLVVRIEMRMGMRICRTARHCPAYSGRKKIQDPVHQYRKVLVGALHHASQRIWWCRTLGGNWFGAQLHVRYLAYFLRLNGLGSRDGSDLHLPWTRRCFPLWEIFVAAHFLCETNTLVHVFPNSAK